MAHSALITGITGQDGSYLAELLLEKGYDVHGMVRRASSFNRERIEHLINDPQLKRSLYLHYGDLSDSSSINQILKHIKPDEIYHLGAQSHVRISFDIPEYTGDVTALGTLRILDAIRDSGIETKFYQASSSEMFGMVAEIPQKETTPFHPRSPYGVAKVYAYWATVNYRESYDMFACNGILFNHESPRRGENFVTRKITISLAKIKAGMMGSFSLGNLDAKRDWGFAGDYVKAMWMMLQVPKADDYVIATGETHTVREFVEFAAQHVGMDLAWEGEGLKEHGIDTKTKKTIVTIDPRFFRPAEVDMLIGDATKANTQLKWKPTMSFAQLVETMMDADLKQFGATR